MNDLYHLFWLVSIPEVVVSAKKLHLSVDVSESVYDYIICVALRGTGDLSKLSSLKPECDEAGIENRWMDE